jgi:undecaprenyl-diphosphatase
MEWWQAAILGVIEGITEFLPVSSTGHLLVAQELLGIGGTTASDAYSICIQAGAIVAVLGLYRARARQLALGAVGRDGAGARLLVSLALAFLPAAIVGLALKDVIKKYLFGPLPIVAAWGAGGIAILLVARSSWLRPDPDAPADSPAATALDPSLRQALLIGIAQCLAMWPGTSRSLVTILAGVLVGLPLAAAVEFSFLLGVVTLGAATAYEAYKDGATMVRELGAVPIAVGFVTAWLSAVLAVRWMVGYLKSHGLELFAAWRLIAALLVAGLIAAGAMPA